MFVYERDTLIRIIKSLREPFPERIKGAYAFGPRARGDHDELSDFDVLITEATMQP